ncbi:HAD-IB family phosphatase [Sphingobacterium hungaricum]|uniref:phosphoserine phosphatase n=1 Tax=Sphingobacterium hungaricum TaxID=2082723 RepID=A0A928UTT7_9SPHI|nr:HAD-IB family phosphatase [Sphingobacterium hungaricum]MBE8713095.1 phosphoserine phosphatase [Sphingobacterium hungaricum]
MKNYYIIDFDSTFTQVEALDELARISLTNNPDREKIYEEIERLTNLAMDGKISFRESLAGRILLLQANKTHLDLLVSHLKKKVSPSFNRNRSFFKEHSENTLIVSGGFKEFITPVVAPYHIKKDQIYANTFLFDEDDLIIGYDMDNPLSEEGGKVKLLKQLKLEGKIYGIGDGYSDFQLKESGLIETFYAFTENISRTSVTEKADHITPSFDEFLYVNDLPRAISYPKNRILCLIVGEVPEIASHILKRDGFSIRIKDTFEEKYTKDVGLLLLGNHVRVPNEQLERADKLKTIGYLGDCRGYISKEICNEKGIVVFDDKKGKSRNAEFIPRRMASFINNGDTDMSRNFPNLILPKLTKAHRLLHIHKNVPGVLAQINTIYAENEINILSQFLMTRGEIGYVVTDIQDAYDKKVLRQLKQVDNTIKFRILYK